MPAFNVSAVSQVAAAGGAGGKSKEHAQANKNGTDRMDGYGKVGMPVIGPFSYMVLAFMKGIISILGQKHIVLTNHRVGLSGSVMFLFVFVIIHAVGNLHVLWGPGILMGMDISTPVCTGRGSSSKQTSLKRANSSFVRCSSNPSSSLRFV